MSQSCMERINKWMESQSLSVDIVGIHEHVTIGIIHKIIILVYVCLYTGEKIIDLHVKKHGYMGGSWGVWYFFYVTEKQLNQGKKRGICMDSAGSPKRT